MCKLVIDDAYHIASDYSSELLNGNTHSFIHLRIISTGLGGSIDTWVVDAVFKHTLPDFIYKCVPSLFIKLIGMHMCIKNVNIFLSIYWFRFLQLRSQFTVGSNRSMISVV